MNKKNKLTMVFLLLALLLVAGVSATIIKDSGTSTFTTNIDTGVYNITTNFINGYSLSAMSGRIDWVNSTLQTQISRIDSLDTKVAAINGSLQNLNTTRINTTSLYAGNVYFGQYDGSQNATRPYRPLTTNAEDGASITKTVCAVGCDYNTIQAAVNDVPLILRNNYNIYISDGTYAEDVYVPPIISSSQDLHGEGSVAALEIWGNASDYDNVKVRSFQISTVSGALGLFLTNLEVYGQDPNSDENASISVYGSNEVTLRNIVFTGTVNSGVLSYASHVMIQNSTFTTNQKWAVHSKHESWVLLGDGGDSPTSGTGSTSTALVKLDNGFVTIADNVQINAPTNFTCNGAGYGQRDQASFCNNAVATSIQFRGLAAGQPNMNIEGFNNSIANIRTSSSSARTLNINNTGSAALHVKLEDGNLTITQMAGTGNDYVCVDATGLLFRSNTAC